MKRRRWMKRRSRRKNRGRVPDDQSLMNQFRGPGRCEFCLAECRSREAAHIYGRGLGGWSRLDVRLNLVALGGPFDCACHHKSHLGLKPTALDLLDVVARREGMTAADVKDAILSHLWGPRREASQARTRNGRAVHPHQRRDVPPALDRQPPRNRRSGLEADEAEGGWIEF